MITRLKVNIARKANGSFYEDRIYIIEGVYFVDEHKDFKIVRMGPGSRYYEEIRPKKILGSELWLYKAKMRTFKLEVVQKPDD